VAGCVQAAGEFGVLLDDDDEDRTGVTRRYAGESRDSPYCGA
jgi:hypothetical protein